QATDELAEMILRYPDAAEIFKSNLSLVAASAITYLTATQTPSKAVFGKNTDGRKQFGVRIGFKNDIEANTMVFGGLPGYRVQDLDASGKLLIASLEHQRPRRHKSVWMDRDPAVALMERYEGRIPELDAMSYEGYWRRRRRSRRRSMPARTRWRRSSRRRSEAAMVAAEAFVSAVWSIRHR